MSDPSGSNQKIIGWSIVAVCVVLAIIIVIAVSGDDDRVEKYLRKNFDHVSGVEDDYGIVFKDNGSVATVASKIARDTRADDNRASGTSQYLRYDDDYLVVVEPRLPSGSTITLYEYESGASQHSTVIGVWGWSSYGYRDNGGSSGGYSGGSSGGSSFRGGGSGFGK